MKQIFGTDYTKTQLHLRRISRKKITSWKPEVILFSDDIWPSLAKVWCFELLTFVNEGCFYPNSTIIYSKNQKISNVESQYPLGAQNYPTALYFYCCYFLFCSCSVLFVSRLEWNTVRNSFILFVSTWNRNSLDSVLHRSYEHTLNVLVLF